MRSTIVYDNEVEQKKYEADWGFSCLVQTENGQNLLFDTGAKGSLLPGVGAILEVASSYGKPYALIGGLHGFRALDLLKELNLVCPCHCTKYKSEIKRLYPEKCTNCGVGKTIEI